MGIRKGVAGAAAGVLLALLLAAGLPGARAAMVVDDFEGDTTATNAIGNRANVFLRQPSRTMVGRRLEIIEGRKTQTLMLRYDKRNTGGPFDSGGWCGYYTLLKTAHAVSTLGLRPGASGSSEEYFDASPFRSITFWVRGQTGQENFVVGVADKHWDHIGDSLKSQPIGNYLPGRKLTTEWQKAVIPLDEFFLDQTQLASIAVVFEGDLFPETGGVGTVYLDEIKLE